MEWLRIAIAGAGGVVAVGRAAGVSDEHLCNLLSGHRRLTPKVAAKLAPVLQAVSNEQWIEATMGLPFRPKDKRRGPRIQIRAQDSVDPSTTANGEAVS